jgi:hypothetical protein
MNKLLERIASKLTGINLKDLTTAERDIAQMLETAGYLCVKDHVGWQTYERLPKRGNITKRAKGE